MAKVPRVTEHGIDVTPVNFIHSVAEAVIL
jgi:hypothetical protein